MIQGKQHIIGGLQTISCYVLPIAPGACPLRHRRRVASQQTRQVASSTTLTTEVNGQETPALSAPAVPAPSAASHLDEFSRTFNWLSYWYPVQTLAGVDPSRPHAVELLGKQLVLWKDGQGKWRCMEDLCPHRLAPLSEGRIESDGTLQCSYHGWRFDGQGRCTEIPQAIDEKAKAVACSSSRSCVTSYPVREDCGLIWLWPTAGPAAEEAAAAAPTPLSKNIVNDWRAGNPQGVWYRRELPYSWDILMENLVDPSHLPFSHHKLSPALTRSKGEAPMPFTAVDMPEGNTADAAAARPGFVLEHRAPLAAFEFPSAMSPAGRVAFTPPINVTYEYNLGPLNRMQNDLIAVPAGPGRSVAYTSGRNDLGKVQVKDLLQTLFKNPRQFPITLFRFKYQRQPAHMSHLQMNKLFDQDSLFLNMQDRQLALRGKSSWVKDYYMPTQADGLVIAGRKWADFALQLPLTDHPAAAADAGTPTAADAFSLTASAAAATRAATQREIGDRYNQHTKHCTICQKALKGMQQQLQLAQSAAAGLAVAVIGVLAGVVVPGICAAVAAAAGKLDAFVAAAASSGIGVAAVVAAVLAVAALFAKSVAASLEKNIAEFVYVDFSHADNH